MTTMAVFDVRWFALPSRIAAHCELIQREAAALGPEEFVDWPERAAYSGGWQVFPLRLDLPPAGMVVDLEHNRRRCPGLAALLADPRIPCAGVSRLLPGCHIYPHTDRPEPDVMRFHLGLRCSGRAGLRIGGDAREQVDGAGYVFDHSIQHEAGNLGDQPRDVLLVDFRLSRAELQIVARLRRGERPDAAAAG